MKNVTFIILCITIILTSCKPSNSSNHQIAEKTASISVPEDTSDTCFTSYQIYAETAFLWQASWVTYFNEFRGEDFKNSPQLNFEESKLDSMFLEVWQEDNPGVIMWYVMQDTNDIYPSLAMQNTVSCILDENSPILLSPSDGSANSFITQSYLETIKGNWAESSFLTKGVITEVLGYNYSWSSIRSLIDANAAPSGIFVNYGLRTIEPGEIGYIENPLTNKTGSIVYCNVVYDSENEGNPLSTLDDFAMPCPRFCGDNKISI